MSPLVDKSILAGMDESLQTSLHTAFAILANSGLWQKCIDLEKQKLFTGSVDEDLSSLADRILEGRKRVLFLSELQTLGLTPQRTDK